MTLDIGKTFPFDIGPDRRYNQIQRNRHCYIHTRKFVARVFAGDYHERIVGRARIARARGLILSFGRLGLRATRNLLSGTHLRGPDDGPP